ncbi:iron-containing alcohol dehydrogenase [Thalassomonas actiniarum]|uniref:Iron-containing alcohol dehydrogenase n=1 Tax=Thalassomonas actiniarum TaxID=485447 RepID=A0AAE9YIU6_9GAMM|nr:iron-containing alcohol dehydrogenase [Thalassomonas actiniarum]WDD96949.1 iron-containing alcohol dehydrogenase [Thalassomonas actiniarum]
MDFNQFDANWNYPTTIRNGIGRIKELPLACKELGMKAPLLITDPGLADTPMVQQALENCRREGLRCDIFSGIKSNPSGENVTDGVSAYWQGEHDGVIAFGGGSALDAAKAVALMVGQDRPLWDFEDIGNNWTRVRSETMAPLVAVPTTSGTGSEVGRASVITDEAQHIKRIIFHPKMLPAIVILDAQLTTGLPEKLTAATGMDALSHALEAYCAPYFHPMAEGIALEAIRLVKNYLPRATADGNDIEARAQMMVASTMGATAFQRGLGGMHALAHPLGAVYDSHHGLLNAILMPYVLKANRSAIETRIERLARYLELPDSSFDGFVNWILALREQLNIPHALSDIGIDATRASDIGEMAQNDPSAGGNPIPFTAQEYTDICLSAINGTF